MLCETWKAAHKDIITAEEMERKTNVEKREEFFKMLIPSGKGQFYIAYDGEIPCAICSTCQTRDADMEGYGEVVAIYVMCEYWGKNVGKKLMDVAIEGLKGQGFKNAMLWAFEVNKRARRFYEKYGFVFDGTYKESGFINTKEVRYRLELY